MIKRLTLSVLCASLPAFCSLPYVYYTNYGLSGVDLNGSVTVANWQTNTIVATIPVQGHPEFIAANPNGNAVYVRAPKCSDLRCGFADYLLYDINPLTNQIIHALSIGPNGFQRPTVTPDGRFVWLITYDQKLVVICAATFQIIETRQLGPHFPVGLTFSPDSKLAYLLVPGNQDEIDVLDVATKHLVKQIPVTLKSASPYFNNLQISPDGNYLYVGADPVSVVSTKTGTVVNSYSLSQTYIVLTPDGKHLWGATTSDLNVDDALSGTPVYHAPGDLGNDLQFTPDGKYDWKAEPNSVVVEDASTHTTVTTLPGRGNEGAIAFLPYTPAAAEPDAGAVPLGEMINIVSLNSGKCLQTNTESGGQLVQSTCSSADDQKFIVDPVKGGYEITAVNTGLQLDIYGASKAAGAAIVQWPFWGGASQTWNFRPITNGYFEITPASTNDCLDVYGASKADGAKIVQWSCYAGPNQQWKLVMVR